MNARARKQLVAGGALGAMLIGTVALSSAATADQIGDDQNVDVSVEIESTVEPGNLAFTVAAESTSLAETTSTVEGTREFTGELPAVTVTDTRSSEEIPEGAAWYVLGEADTFVNENGDEIGAENLGWTPAIVEGDELGLVSEGPEVDPALEGDADESNNVGLVAEELLASTFDSREVAADGSWTANAGLTLRTGEDVEGGSYNSTITLSLLEGGF